MKLSAIFFVLCSCGTSLAAPAFTEDVARNFIKDSSDDFYSFYNTITDIAFNIEVAELLNSESETTNAVSTSESSEELTSEEVTTIFGLFMIMMKLGVIAQAAENITTLAEESHKFSIKDFTDESVKLGMMNIKLSPDLFVAGEEYINWLFDDFDDMQEKNDICDYKVADKCDLKYSAVIKAIKNSSDAKELLHYWTQMRNRNKEAAAKKVQDFIKLIEIAATKFGEDAMMVLFSNYIDSHFLDEMEKVVKEIEPLYKDLHAHIRYSLVEKYGSEIVSPTGPIQHQFFEQAVSQAWTPDAFISKHLENVTMPIEKNISETLTGEEVAHNADEFMKSMGFSELPSDFWMERFGAQNDDSDECTTELYDITPKIYMKYCPKTNIKKFFQTYAQIARAHYANQKKDLPFAHFHSYSLENAVGEAIILSSASSDYLSKVGLRVEPTMSSDEHFNRVYRMGVHTLLSVPVYFVHTKVIADVLGGKVPNADINKHYWDLMKEYVGVVPPNERDSTAFDFPQQFYNHLGENHATTKFISEIAGYQIYDAVCNKAGQQNEVIDSHRSYNCNLYDNKDAGKILMEMMQLGSTKSWKQVLGHVTGNDNGMSGDAILKYYKSLELWLTKYNEDNNVPKGW